MLIGIAGFKYSGKDTMGKYLHTVHGFQRHSFAERLKKAAKLIFNLSEEQVNGKLKEVMDRRYPFTGIDPVTGDQMTQIRHGVPEGEEPSERAERSWWVDRHGGHYPRFLTPRLIMTTLGTEYGRRLYSNIWIDGCMEGIRDSHNEHHCITDVRFHNEIVAIKNAGGVVVRLLRGKLASNHDSEKELAEMDDTEFDYAISNNDTLERFREGIETVLEIQRSRS